MHRVLSVPDVGCAHCVSAVEGAVSEVPGVSHVAVDLDAKSVTVDGEYDEAAVLEAIVAAGYSVAGPA